MNTPELPPMTLKDWYVFAWDRRTTIYGYLVSLMGVLAASDVLSPKAIKYVLLVSGVLTAGLGHFNNARIKQESK